MTNKNPDWRKFRKKWKFYRHSNIFFVRKKTAIKTTEIYLHGYVDRIDVAPTGEVRIVDYKSGKSPKPGWEEKALFQLRVYALLYWRLHGVIPSLLVLHYLGDARSVRSSPNEKELLSTEKKLLQIADEIIEAIAKDHFPPKPSKLCDWCFFKTICPAHN